MSEITISREDLLRMTQTVGRIAVSPWGALDYRNLVHRILDRNENYSAQEGFLIAAFMGLKDLGLDNSDAVDFATRGLESFGVKVSLETEGVE